MPSWISQGVLKGTTGAAGPSTPSADAGNSLSLGSDSLLFVHNGTAAPLDVPVSPSTYTLGDTTSGATSGSLQANSFIAQPITVVSSPSYLQSITVRVVTPAGNLRAALYDATGSSGHPGALIAAMAGPLVAGVGLNTLSLASPILVSPGNYWLVLFSDNAALTIDFTTGGGLTVLYGNSGGITFGASLNPFPSVTVNSWSASWCLYATFATSLSADATSGQVVKGTDSRLTDARTPTAHHTTHESGGSDVIAIRVSADGGNSLSQGSDSAPYLATPLKNRGGSTVKAILDVATVDFGSADNGGADIMIGQTTVSASWVTANSFPVATLCTGSDHTDQEDMLIEELEVFIANIVNGVSFDVMIYAPNGASGVYQVNWMSSY